MRGLVYILCSLFLLTGPAAHARPDGKQIMHDLLQAGLQAVEENTRHPQQPVGESTDDTTDGPTGQDVPAPQRTSSTAMLVRAVRDSLQPALESLKEQYKEEGKVYVRQLGDLLAERIAHNPRIQATLTLIKTLCWVLVIYLIIVSLALLVSMGRLRRNDREILRLLREILDAQQNTERN